MADFNLNWLGDLSVSATGDLALVNDPELGTQRLIRRLMTNQADYIWNPSYGAGLAQYVGRPSDPAAIKATIWSQISMESAVSQEIEPIIHVSSDAAGSCYVAVQYQDSATAQTAPLTIKLGS